MQLKKINIERSPEGADRLRVVGEVIYDDGPSKPELYWFEYPKSHEKFLSTSGNAWVSCLAPLAMKIGEPLYINAEVDPVHLDNTRQFIKVFKIWFPELTQITVDVKQLSEPKLVEKKTLAFFSSGIDSLFTLLRYNGGLEKDPKEHIDSLAMIFGFDIPLNKREFFVKKFERARQFVDQFGVELFEITTNIRETRIKDTNWGSLTHGAALGALGLCLEKGYSRVLIASSGGYADLTPWGSHILTDPLFSTSKTSFSHDTPEYERWDKLCEIIKFKPMMEILHVCNHSFTHENCCRCEKCLRTLIIIDLLGQLDQCVTFDLRKYDPLNIKKIFMLTDKVEIDWQYIKRLAVEKKRPEIFSYVEHSFRSTRKIRTKLDFIDRFHKTRVLWRLSHHWRRRIEKGVII